MVKRVGSSRRKSRELFSVSKKMKGKIPVSSFVKKITVGEHVHLDLEPSVNEGVYFRRFHGRTGMVVGMQGSCYKVKIRDGGKEKTLVIAPVHLNLVRK